MPMHPDLIKRTHSTMLIQMTPEDQLQVAQECIETGYRLVWDEEDYDQAIEVLSKAITIQQNILGKHHLTVGHTANYIGTAFWLQNKLGDGLKYFLEARRIYCKSGQGKIKGVDQRIHSILKGMGLDDDEIDEYRSSIQCTIDHELRADFLKQKGLHDQARREYGIARRYSATLMNLIA